MPLEEHWGMQGQYATVDVREAVSFSMAHCTAKETAQILKKCALFNPGMTAIKNIVEAVGDVFNEHYESIQDRVLSNEQTPPDAKAVAVSMDGANILMREKGSTQRRPGERPGKDFHDDTTQSCYKNAMVGSISYYTGKKKEPDGGPQRLHSLYTSAMPQYRAQEFKVRLEREVAPVIAAADAKAMKKILVMDGSRGLWNYALHNDLYQGFIPVVDFYHMTEHLSKAAEAIFGKQNPAARKWYVKWKGKMLNKPGTVHALLRSIDYYSTTLSLSRRKALKAERTFFSRNHARMNYSCLRRQNLPISSGPVEAACKSIVKSRMCRSGMRWSRSGGQKILDIRTFVKSNRWNAAWNCYKSYAKVA
ncbi:MAG: hypothetical protein GF398_10445 [Chitinivibrionales bacterium]|nr:hypothetical protein [Chitinivibrionales bacterium]